MNLPLRRTLDSLARRLAAPAAVAALALALIGLAGCNAVVGSGNAPKRLVIVQPSTTTPLPTLKMYQCLTSALSVLLYFDDGAAGNYTNRVTWSSSNVGAVQVSNGDVPIPGTTSFYPSGSLIPRGPGAAVVTASYFGIETQIAINVGTPQNIHLAFLQDQIYRPLYQINLDQSPSSPRNFFTMGAGSQLQVAAVATLDGTETDVSKFADFHFQVPNVGVANISTTGVITALSRGGPLVPVASFPSCDLDNISDPNGIVSMTVQPILSIDLRSELAADPQQPLSATNQLAPLVAGNSEKFTVVANLANGDKQDVHPQTVLTSNNSSVAAFGTSGANNVLTSTEPGGPIVVSGLFSGGNVSLQTSSFSTSAEQLQLSTIQVCWSDPVADEYFNVYTAPACKDPTDPAYVAPTSNPTVGGGSLTPIQFHAVGNYGLNPDGTGYIYQDVTRNTVWSSSVPAVATTSNNPVVSGQVQAVTIGPGSSTITATNSKAVNLSTVQNQLQVLPANLADENNPLP